LRKEKMDQHELLHNNTRVKSENEEEENRPEKVDIRVWLSCLEVYNESIRDLMIDRNAEIQTQLKVKLDKNGKVTVPGLTQTEVHNTEEVRQLLKNVASKNRASGVTNMNAHSSRSHCVIFIDVWIETRRKISANPSDVNEELEAMPS